MTPSQSYLFPNDLTQRVDHISFGGLAEDSWIGTIEPEWIKKRLSRKISKGSYGPLDLDPRTNEMLRSGVGCFQRRLKKRKKGGSGNLVWNLKKSTLIWESQADGHMPSTFLRAGTKPQSIHKIYLLFLFLPLIKLFIRWFFLLLVPCPFSTPTQPLPAKGGRDSKSVCQRATDLCVQLFWF